MKIRPYKNGARNVHNVKAKYQVNKYCLERSYFYRPQVKVMFSQLPVCPQSVSWLLVHCSAFLQRGWYASYWNAVLFSNSFPLTRNEISISISRFCRIFFIYTYFLSDKRLKCVKLTLLFKFILQMFNATEFYVV